MTKIVAFAGKKQVGKTTSGLYTLGHVLHQQGLLPAESGASFGMSEDGKLQLMINDRWTVFDEYNYDPWTVEEVWPVVKIYHLADILKNVAINVFGLDAEKTYGSDEDKNSLTEITWNDIRFILAPRFISKLKKSHRLHDHLTIREFLQYFGTDVCRKIKPNCWVSSLLDRIGREAPRLALICDCRFPDEVQNLKEFGATVIKINRLTNHDDQHASETALEELDEEIYDAVINNEESMTLQDKNYQVLDVLYDLEILPLSKD